MFKKKYKFNIDKLKLCFIQPQQIYDKFKDVENQSIINRDGYSIRVIENDKKVNIKFQIIINGSELGKLKLNNSNKYEGFCFFEFSNKALYTNQGDQDNKINLINLIRPIINDLGISVLNTITEIEIALDVNFNITARLRKLIKHSEKYEMFVNGARITDPSKRIEDYLVFFNGSRNKLSRMPTIQFKQAKRDGALVRTYNKTDEIKNSSDRKDYINQWNEFGTQDTHRVEVRLKSNTIKDYLTKYRIETDLIDLIADPVFWEGLWREFSNRVVRFRDRETKRDIDLIDLLTLQTI